MTDQPAPFEQLRKYMEQAVDQLLKDMQGQAVAYAVPATDVLALVKAVAKVRGEMPLWTLDGWALRHFIPIHNIIESAEHTGVLVGERKAALRQRLLDALGYVILALVLTEGDGT